VQLLSRHDGIALIGAVLALAGLALAVTGTGSPMFARRPAGGGPAGVARRVGLAAAALGVAVAAAALATG
jgi:hypothetical protein